VVLNVGSMIGPPKMKILKALLIPFKLFWTPLGLETLTKLVNAIRIGTVFPPKSGG